MCKVEALEISSENVMVKQNLFFRKINEEKNQNPPVRTGYFSLVSNNNDKARLTEIRTLNATKTLNIAGFF